MKVFKIGSDILNYLNSDDYAALKDIFKDHELYLVGGVVRDILLGRSPKDFDFCTDSHRGCTYILGMSVPPIMIKRVVDSLIEQGVYDYKLKKER